MAIQAGRSRFSRWAGAWLFACVGLLAACSDDAANPTIVAVGDAALADTGSDIAADTGKLDAVDGVATDVTQLTDGASQFGDTVLTDTQADTGPELPAPPKGQPSATVTAPAKGTVIEFGQVIDLAGMVSDTLALPTELTVTWTSDKDGLLGASPPDAQGVVKLNGVKLSAGKHFIQLQATNKQGISAVDGLSIGVCAWVKPESFDTKLDGAKWQTSGDAYWDPGGWLEMTGNAQSKFGKIWNVVDHVSPGDVQISFKIQTGGGMNGGADGFAMSVIDAKDVVELQSILDKAGNGGCLGYGVAGGCGTLKISAFHLEIDTFDNTGDPNTDPTYDDHIAVTLDGDASKHWLWAATPTIEDMQWHTVTIEVKLDVVRVTLDTQELFNAAIPDFKFRGGYIGFSGSTGWASNYHRFDDLQILQQCLVQ